ncbi:hypothetical protein DVS77_03765 [Mycolicibacterium moriokaense]|nr:hypothetical protein DVS77_03765 [Mycolicibacterium moriokaense]
MRLLSHTSIDLLKQTNEYVNFANFRPFAKFASEVTLIAATVVDNLAQCVGIANLSTKLLLGNGVFAVRRRVCYRSRSRRCKANARSSADLVAQAPDIRPLLYSPATGLSVMPSSTCSVESGGTMSSSSIQFSTSLRPILGLRYARYVGRVGALAVSLGVGFAIASTPGIAYADESTNTTTTDATPTDGAGAAAADSTSQRRHSRASDVPGMIKAFAGGTAQSARPPRFGRPRAAERRDTQQQNDPVESSAEQIEASGNTVAEAKAEEGAVGGATTRSPRARTVIVRRSTDDAARQRVSDRTMLPTPSLPATAVGAATTTRAPAVRQRAVDAKSVTPATSAATPVIVNRARAARAVTVSPLRPAAATAATPEPPAAPARVAVRPVALVSGFLAAVGLAPSLTSPATPAPAPATFTWAVLAFVRREIEQIHRTYFNRTPVARDDAVATDEDTPLTFDPRANDRDDDTVKVTGVTNGMYGNVTFDGTTVTYTPNAAADALAADEIATDTFTYTVSDADSPWHLHGFLGFFGRGHTDTATVTVTLKGVNDAPTAVNDEVNNPVSEDAGGTVIDVLANDVDPDHGDTKTITGVTQGRYGTVTDNGDGTLTYTPDSRADALAADEAQTDSFSYTMSDRSGATSTATVSISLIGVNDPPVVQDSALSIREDQMGAILVQVVDPDLGDRHRIEVVQGTKGTATVTGTTITYTPSPETQAALLSGQTANDAFTYTVTDSQGASATATVSVTISGLGNTGSISTGDATPVDVEFGYDGDRGVIRNEDGTLTWLDYDQDEGWSVGAGVDVTFDVGHIALDAGYGYADVTSDNPDDADTMAVIDLETGADLGRVTDVRTGLAYRFDDVTDVAVDRRVPTAEVVYAVDSSGAVYEIDAARREVVSRVDTRTVFLAADATATAVSGSPKLAVAPGSQTVYVASGNKISVLRKQPVATARFVGDADATAVATTELVHRADMDITLESGDEITALEVGADGTLYATVASADAGTARLVRINVDPESGMLTEGRSVQVGRDATALTISDDLGRAYVTSAADQRVSVVGLRQLTVLDAIQTGAATGVAVAPGTNTVLVANPEARAISLVKESAVTTDAPITITLAWGSQPADLDAHLLGATDDGTFHVYYGNPTWTVGDETGADLNVDDRDGGGPEVISFNRLSPGTYLYYVDNFSNDGGLITSATTVTIKDQGSGQTLYAFELPAKDADDTGTERYWAVFAMTIDDDGLATFTPLSGDPFVSVAPTLGSSSSGGVLEM